VAGGAATLLLGGGLAVVSGSAAVAVVVLGGLPSDFNGDGISDVAIGEPLNGGGRVHVLYATRSGLQADATASTPDDQLITAPFAGSGRFGQALAAGDFNGDDYSDLAVGAPLSLIPGGDGVTASGFVRIFNRSPAGLNLSAPHDVTGMVALHTPATADEFGSLLAVGNFNRDGTQDLVISATAENAGNGAVYIVPGGGATARRFVQGRGGVPAGDGTTDNFGFGLAVGDFNANGVSDLAIGEPLMNGGKGAVVVMNGSGDASLLSSIGGKLWSQDTVDAAGRGIAGVGEAGDVFGFALAAGDFDGTGGVDLAVGVPGEDLDSAVDAGMVNVIYSGGASGLVVTGNQAWTQNTAGISGTAESGDHFGGALVAGNFDGALGADLAVGVPFEKLGSVEAAGMVNVIYSGGSAGLTGSHQQAWSQASTGIAGTPENDDFFGSSLAEGRIHSGGRDDLVIGAPGEGIDTIMAAGLVHLLPSSSTGLTATGSQSFHANTPGVQGAAVTGGLFGFGLTNSCLVDD